MGNHVELTAERLEVMRGLDPSESFDMINLLKFRPTVEEGLGIDGTTGRRAYFKHYAGQVDRIFERLGLAAEFQHMNDAHATLIGLDGEEWDFVAIVRYPSRAEFLMMVDDPEWQAIERFRTGSLINSRLIESHPTSPGSVTASKAGQLPDRTVVNAGDSSDPRSAQLAQRQLDEPTYMFNLVRFKDDGAAYNRYVSGLLDSGVGRTSGLEIVWSAVPIEPLVGPGDELWDMALMARYPTRRQMLELFNSEEYQREHGPVRAAALCDSRLVETSPR